MLRLLGYQDTAMLARALHACNCHRSSNWFEVIALCRRAAKHEYRTSKSAVDGGSVWLEPILCHANNLCLSRFQRCNVYVLAFII